MSKQDKRNQTGIFLGQTPATNSFKLSSQNQYYTGISNELSLSEDKSLTGAAEPILPFSIATIGKNGKRVDFTMLISPETMNHGKTQSYQVTYTRAGYIPQLWGPNLDTLSSTGKSAATMNPSLGMDNTLQTMSFGYLNLLSLIGAYRNNGYSFLDRLGVEEVTRVIETVSGVQIMYDNQIFMGHFTNFSLDEDDEHPYLFNYNFEFIISALNGTESQIRGHYKALPSVNVDYEGTAADPTVISTISSLYSDQPVSTKKLIKPNSVDDSITERLWMEKTGLTWDQAITLGLTDGTVQGNLGLRKKLYGKTWDPNTKQFIDISVVQTTRVVV